MVYISSSSITAASRQGVMQAQSDLSIVQQELSSGTLADAGLSLGGQSGQLVTLANEKNRLQTITTANALATTRLSATTSALDTIRTAATSFLSDLTTASSGSGSSTVATTAASSLAALTATLNTAVAGQYVFAGINTSTQPMTTYTASPASANKQAVDTAFLAAFGTSQTSSAAADIDGTAVQSFLDSSFASLFDATSYGSTWSTASSQVISSQISASQTADTSVSANQDAFRKLAQAYTMVSEFGSGTLSASATKAVAASAATLVNSALSSLTTIEAGVGTTQTAISTADTSMAAQMTVLSTQSDALDDVDSYALTTKVSTLQTQIEASYELTAKLQSMSLVNYLG